MNVQRPRRGQTEEDLLREAERLNAEGFQHLSVHKENIVKPEKPRGEPVESPSSSAPMTVFQRDVVERQPGEEARSTVQRRTAFPSVFKVNVDGLKPKTKLSTGTKKRSLFAQAMDKESSKVSEPGLSRKPIVLSSNILKASTILSDEDKTAIHEENQLKINTMTEEEIQSHIKSLPSDVVKFFKQRRQLQARDEEKTSQNETQATDWSSGNKAHDNVVQMDVDTYDAIELKKYPHMGKEEPEKMQWMGELTQVPKNTPIGLSARFNFDGELILASEDIPVTAGLHHHGEEQERAGYTVEEMLVLARSSNLQQRVIAFNMLAKVIQKFKMGAYDGGVFEQNLLTQLLDHDVLILLRSSLDENVETLREACLFCFRQLIDNQFDELVLDFSYALSPTGHVQPSLPTSVALPGEDKKEYMEEKDELTDAKVIALDVVLGCLRTDLLQRFSYLLNNLPLTSSSVANIMCILTRIARHSQETATLVMKHEEILQIAGKAADLKTKSDHIVVSSSLKLLRVLSSWSKEWAELIATKVYDVRSNLPQYLILESGSVVCTVEALRLWDCLCRMNIMNDLYLDVFPIVMKYLLALRGAIEQDSNQEDKVSLTVSCSLFKVLGAIAKSVKSPNSQIHWRNLSDVFNIIEGILPPLIKKSTITEPKAKTLLTRLLTSILFCFEQLWQTFRLEEDENKVEEKAQKVIKTILSSLLNSEPLKDCVQECLGQSGLLSVLKDGRERDPKNLPSFGAVSQGGVVVPSACETSPFFLLNASLTLTNTLASTQSLLYLARGKLLSRHANGLLTYLKRITDRGCGPLMSSWFVADEVSFLFQLIKLVSSDTSTWNEIDSIRLCDNVLRSIGSRNADILRNMFHFLMHELFQRQDVSDVFSTLNLNENGIDRTFQTIVQSYERILPMTDMSLTAKNNGEVLLPTDWRYVPLLNMFSRSEQNKPLDFEKDLEFLKVCIHCVLLDLSATRALSDKEAALHFSRMSTIFLLTSNQSMFMDPIVQKLCKKFLSLLLQKCPSKPSFDHPIPGLDSFDDFFSRLVTQFFADSYGNPVFSSFILYPTLNNIKLRSILLWDHCENLRAVTMKKEELPDGFPIEDLFKTLDNDDSENELNIVRGCVKAVLSRTIVESRNPLLFEIAEKNISRAMASCDQNVLSVVSNVEG